MAVGELNLLARRIEELDINEQKMARIRKEILGKLRKVRKRGGRCADRTNGENGRNTVWKTSLDKY